MCINKLSGRAGNSRKKRLSVVLAAASLLTVPAMAGQLIYTPVNPTFGGHPQNGPYLMSKAQAGKKYSMDMDFPDFGMDLMLLAQVEVNGRETLIFQKGEDVYAYDVATGTTRRTDFNPGSGGSFPDLEGGSNDGQQETGGSNNPVVSGDGNIGAAAATGFDGGAIE